LHTDVARIMLDIGKNVKILSRISSGTMLSNETESSLLPLVTSETTPELNVGVLMKSTKRESHDPWSSMKPIMKQQADRIGDLQKK
jgi:hypothetical protein